MMIAVALTPIVLYAGFWAGMQWATVTWIVPTPPVVVAAPPVAAGRTATTNVLPTTTQATDTVEVEIESSTPAALAAMALTTALLAMLWVLLARCFKRT